MIKINGFSTRLVNKNSDFSREKSDFQNSAENIVNFHIKIDDYGFEAITVCARLAITSFCVFNYRSSEIFITIAIAQGKHGFESPLLQIKSKIPESLVRHVLMQLLQRKFPYHT